MGIILDPKLGVNPKRTFCTRCGRDGGEVMLIGSNKGIYECNAPAAEGGPHRMYGRPKPSTDNGYCPLCLRNARWTRVGEVGEHDRLPATRPCDACLKEMEQHLAVVEGGGVYFECTDCKASGVVKPEAPLAKMAREGLQKEGEKTLAKGWFTEPSQLKGDKMVFVPCGVEINRRMGCPNCVQLQEKKGASNDGGPAGT